MIPANAGVDADVPAAIETPVLVNRKHIRHELLLIEKHREHMMFAARIWINGRYAITSLPVGCWPQQADSTTAAPESSAPMRTALIPGELGMYVLAE